MIKHEPNLAKLEEMTHYIIDKCEHKSNFGKIVLFKLLYFSDFNHYKKNFEGISNEQYRKIEHGPAPIHFPRVLAKLHDDRKIDYEVQKGEFEPWVFKNLEPPVMKHLSADDIKTIDQVIKKIGHLNANQISKLSHQDNPYVASKLKEIINYGLVFYRSEDIERQVE